MGLFQTGTSNIAVSYIFLRLLTDRTIPRKRLQWVLTIHRLRVERLQWVLTRLRLGFLC